MPGARSFDIDLRYALPQQHGLVDARQLAAALADATPTPACPPGTATPRWTRAPGSIDGIVFVKDAGRS
jgi:hypothetical protein